MLALRVCVESIVDGKLSRQSLLVRESHGSESLSNRAQANTLRRNRLFPLYIGCSHDKSESMHGGIRDRVILNDRLEGAPRTPMVKFDGFDPRCIKRSGALSLG